MTCEQPEPIYFPPLIQGLKHVNSYGDGYSVDIFWRKAKPSLPGYEVAYNIYYSTDEATLFTERPKFVSISPDGYGCILDFTPGEVYYFAIRAMQFDPDWVNISALPQDPGQKDGYLRIYPETLLSSDIDETQLTIPITDIDIFPSFGIILIGFEYIRYTSKDLPSSSLIATDRGFLNSEARYHTVDGYDGYEAQDPVVKFWTGYEESNRFIVQEEIAIDDSCEAYTLGDGYKVLDRVGVLTTDLSATEEDRIDFPSYDYVGWHRTPPEDLLQGKCVDSYFGGENFCADSSLGINEQIRNIPIEQQADRREEAKLEQTGQPMILLRRRYNGIVDSGYQHDTEYPDPRGINNFGTQYNTGYEQYFNPRRSDRKILVRFDPAVEDQKPKDAGLDLEIEYPAYTLAVPILNDRDVLIRFHIDGTEEARYEVLNVTRNTLFYGQSGLQKFTVTRLRKTHEAYKWRAVRDVAMFPSELTTSVGLLRGTGRTTIPHTHKIVINENITDISQINQTTSYSQGHNHPIINGIVQPVYGHTHNIILP